MADMRCARMEHFVICVLINAENILPEYGAKEFIENESYISYVQFQDIHRVPRALIPYTILEI